MIEWIFLPKFFRGDQAERRRQLIEESKYLGGDIEHTHLVKGLDYALLQKVKAQEEYGEIVGVSGNSENRNDDDDGDDENEDDGDEEGEKSSKSGARQSSDRTAGVDPVMESAEQKIKMNLKPKILPKTASAALAAALNKSVTENPFAFKKYLESAKSSKKNIIYLFISF